MMKKILLVVSVLATSIAAIAQPSFIKDSIDSYIAEGLKDWQLPGLAVVIVKDGKVVLQKGYGVTNIKTNAPVNDNTLFFIASNSKLFTGTALANLEQEKKLSLNDKITKYYPNYKLYDKTSTDLVTIKDLLTHRIGTETFQGDFTFWNTNLTREQIMEKMRYLKPVNVFRDAYGYCNSCFLTAGMVIPKVANGQSWESYVTEKIIKPLEMTSTTATGNGIANRVSNIATPYTTVFTNNLQQVPYDIWDNLGPAASIVSNVNDLSHWLQLQLDSGKYNGKQVLPWRVLQKTRDMVISTGSRKSSFYPVNYRGYGLGLFTSDYNGKQIYWHTGGAAGMVSNVCFVPEEKLGIAILTNNDNQNFFENLRYQILDAYLDVPYINRSKATLPSFNEEMKKQTAEVAAWRKEVISNKDKKVTVTDYVGTYNNELYGNISITAASANTLKIKFLLHSDLEATLSPMNGNDWLLEYNNIEFGIFKTKFTLQGNRVKSIAIKVNDFVEYGLYTFNKK
jgi:CubicO group peptidase (beta-lactamase class C family)